MKKITYIILMALSQLSWADTTTQDCSKAMLNTMEYQVCMVSSKGSVAKTNLPLPSGAGMYLGQSGVVTNQSNTSVKMVPHVCDAVTSPILQECIGQPVGSIVMVAQKNNDNSLPYKMNNMICQTMANSGQPMPKFCNDPTFTGINQNVTPTSGVVEGIHNDTEMRPYTCSSIVSPIRQECSGKADGTVVMIVTSKNNSNQTNINLFNNIICINLRASGKALPTFCSNPDYVGTENAHINSSVTQPAPQNVSVTTTTSSGGNNATGVVKPVTVIKSDETGRNTREGQRNPKINRNLE